MEHFDANHVRSILDVIGVSNGTINYSSFISISKKRQKKTVEYYKNKIPPVYWVKSMMKSPRVIRVPATISSITFIFTVNGK
jgi:predicted patatin/cPLA2 family phospholipase